MTEEVVSHRKNNAWWTGIGIALAILGLIAVIVALVYGNTWTEEEDTGHGALQAGILIGGAFALGFGVLSIAIGFAKRAGRRR